MAKFEIEVNARVAKFLQRLAKSTAQADRENRLTMRMAEVVLEEHVHDSHAHQDGSKCNAREALEQLKDKLVDGEQTTAFFQSVVEAYKATDEGKATFAEPQAEAEPATAEQPLGDGV